MIQIKDEYDFQRLIQDEDSLLRFEDRQAIPMAICSHLRGYMEWPKIKKRYEDFKIFFGQRSMINKRIPYSDFLSLIRRQKPEQYLVFRFLRVLYNYQLEREDFALRQDIGYEARFLYKIPCLTKEIIEELINDAVVGDDCVAPIMPKIEWHSEPKKMLRHIRATEEYATLPIFADMIEEFHGTNPKMMEFADHFRQGRHSWACKYLRVMK